MKKRNKIILISGIIILSLFIIAAIALVVLFPTEKVRQIAETEATKALGMPVTIKGLHISFLGLPSLRANNIIIGPAKGSDIPLADIETIRTGINLIKILWGEVEITSVRIDKPLIYFVVPPEDTVSAEKPEQKKSGMPLLPFPISMKKMELHDGRIEIINPAANNAILLEGVSQNLTLNINRNLSEIKSKGTLDISNIVFSTTDSTGKSSPLISGIPLKFAHNLDGSLSEGNFNLTDSKLELGAIKTDLTASVRNWQRTEFALETGNIDAEDFLSGFPSSVFPDKEKISSSGNFNLNVKGSYDSSAGEPVLLFNGAVNADIRDIAYTGLPDKIDSVSLDIDFSEKVLMIKIAEMNAGKSKISVQGEVDSYSEKPVVDLKVNGNLETSDLKGALPSLAESKLEGGLDIDLAVDGAVEDPSAINAEGVLKLRELTFALPKLLNNTSKVSGAISLKTNRIAIENLNMVSGKSDFTFNGVISDYMYIIFPQKGKASFFNGKLSSGLIDTIDLLYVDKSVPAPKPWDFEETIKNTPVPPSLNAEAEINFGKIIMGKLRFDSAKGNIILKDGKITLTNLVVNAYNGALTGYAGMNFSNLESVSYDGNFWLKGFDSGAFIADFFGAKNFMSGKLSTDIAFSGAGLDSVSMLNNLNGKGKMLFENGKITGWKFTDELGEYLKFLNFKGFEFDTIANNFTIKDRKVFTPGLTAKTIYGDITLDGYTGFDKAIDYKINLDLNKTYAQKAVEEISALSRIAKIQPNSLELVVDAEGSFNSPKFSLNTEGAQKQLQEEIKTKAEQFLDKNIKTDNLKKEGKKLMDKFFKK